MVLGTDESWTEVNSTTMNKSSVNMKKKSTSKSSVRENKGAGSRRIFSPVFKLQVLDSYRQDADCQGNQRATARKYGIHRRQIQKWLQAEKDLRLSVQQSNTALNLSSTRQSGGNKECNANSISIVQVKKSASISNVTSSDKLSTNDNKLNEVYNTFDSEEYVNVDEITDSEDDTSSCSSNEKIDKALDFTSATLSKRRFYTTDFKLHVLETYKNDEICKGDKEATARKFCVPEKRVQRWLNQESLVKSEQALNNSCLDLSRNKRKAEDVQLEEAESKHKVFKTEQSTTEVQEQESALCLVKNKIEPTEVNNTTNVYHHIQLYPSSTEHSFNNTLNYTNPEYPLYLYQPWNCCYQQISSVRNSFDSFVHASKYSYSLDFKVSNYETSYVDIPVQYGFGDSVPSKWLKENPLYMHQPPSIPVLSSYR